MTEIYTFIVDFEYVPKNKLNEAALQYCKSIDRTAFNSSELELFRNQFTSEIEKLNKTHARSTPIKLDYWDSYKYGDPTISIHGIQSCNVKLIKGNLISLAYGKYPLVVCSLVYLMDTQK